MLKSSLFILFLYFVITSALWGQQKKLSEMSFDSLYVYTSTTLSAENNDSAFIVATSMLSRVDNSLQKLKVLMLLATLYERKGDAINGINYAQQAYELAKKIDNKDWLLRINGFMSTTYRKVDLIKYGKKYLNEAISLSTELKLPLFQAFILQEKALYSINEKNYNQALMDLKESTQVLKVNNQSANLNSFFWATTAQLLGLSYYYLDSLPESKEHYQAALDSVKDIETELKGFCYAGLANISLKQGKLNETAALIQSAEKYSESSKNFELQAIMAQLYIDYYTIKGDTAKVMKSQRDLISINELQKKYTTDVVNSVIEVGEEGLTLSKSKSRAYIMVIIGVMILVFIGLLFLNRYRIRKQKKTYDHIINRMLNDSQFLLHELAYNRPKLNPSVLKDLASELSEHDEIDIQSSYDKVPDDNDELSNLDGNIRTRKEEVKEWKKNIISEEYTKLLEEKLSEFEQSNSFLKPNLTLTSVASELNTNTKYLSVFISQYKDPHFNDYINRLRINYIIQKLHSNPAYREYKISYLAEECGFSSHAKFATVFKEMLGISPSIFIQNLKQ